MGDILVEHMQPRLTLASGKCGENESDNPDVHRENFIALLTFSLQNSLPFITSEFLSAVKVF